MAELHLHDKPSPNSSDKSKTSLLSLPDEIISQIFQHISSNMKYTLQSSIDAMNLASTNKRLQRIFSTHLTKITPILHHLNASTLSEQHLAALIKHAGQNLQELHVPIYTHRYVPNLPDLCPNIEVLHMFDNDIDEFSEDNRDNHRNDMAQVIAILPRLKLRKLMITRPPKDIFNVLRSRMPEELHLCGVYVHQLSLLLPILSHPLKVLKVITIGASAFCKSFKDFIDTLYKAVPNIQSLTIHGPSNEEPTPQDVFPMQNPPAKFRDLAATLIASVREHNPTHSKCTSIDIRGVDAFDLLFAVNRNAVITVSLGTVTLHDDVSTGTYITSLALDNSLCDQDVRHLERVFLLQPEEPAYWLNPVWSNRLKNHRLHVVRAYVAEGLNCLNLSTEVLELSVRILPDVTDWKILSGVRELYLLDIFSLTTACGSYEELLLVLKELPSIVDELHGDLIWVDNSIGSTYTGCGDPHEIERDELAAVEDVDGFYNQLIRLRGQCRRDFHQIKREALAAMEAVNRFIMHGGDAATLQTWLSQISKSVLLFLLP